MNRLTVAAIVAVVAIALSVILPSAFAQEPVSKDPIKPTVEHQWVKKPHNERVVRHFIPWAHPTVAQVKNVIIPYEAHRWGGGPIYDRVACESGFHWDATNGTYNGLVQTSGDFWWGAGAWPSSPRDVTLHNSKRVVRGVYLIRLWSDGHKSFQRIRNAYVKRTVIRKGMIPRTANEWHGWAAIRVGQRAVGNDGPTTYWACIHNGSGHY